MNLRYIFKTRYHGLILNSKFDLLLSRQQLTFSKYQNFFAKLLLPKCDHRYLIFFKIFGTYLKHCQQIVNSKMAKFVAILIFVPFVLIGCVKSELGLEQWLTLVNSKVIPLAREMVSKEFNFFINPTDANLDFTVSIPYFLLPNISELIYLV